jgi:hypothetical protein
VNQETLEFTLGAMFIALSCAGLDKEQRAFAIDTLHCCADLPNAPRLAPDILRRVARVASNNADKRGLADVKADQKPRRHLQVIQGGNSAA